jgi:hypothetical protein
MQMRKPKKEEETMAAPNPLQLSPPTCEDRLIWDVERSSFQFRRSLPQMNWDCSLCMANCYFAGYKGM